MTTKSNSHSKNGLGIALRVAPFVAAVCSMYCFCAPVVPIAIAYQSPQEGPSVRVFGFAEDEQRGRLAGASSEGITLQTDGSQKKIPSNDVSRVEFVATASATKGPVEVTMIDGSKIRGKRIIGKDQAWKLENNAGQLIPLANQALRACLLKELPANQISSWQSNIAETKDSDALVVLRAGGVLDRISGLIVEIRDTEIMFDLDGQSIGVPMEKVAGLIWFRRGLERIKPTVEIATTDGSIWFAETFQINAKELSLKLQYDQTVVLPVEALSRINYASANIRWVADLETVESTPTKRMAWKSDIPTLNVALSPRFIATKRNGSSENVGSDLDLHFPSPGSYTFRAPDGFTSFQGLVERSDSGSQRSDLTIEVWQDDERILQQNLPANKESVKVETSVVPGKKIRLVVACPSKLMIGTEVQWKQPRLKR